MLLQIGSNGPDVGKLEGRLSELGLYTGQADNIFGSGVQAAVKAFQQSNGLTADGVVGDQTWAALFPGAAPSSTTTAGTTTPGLSPDTPIVQRCLALTGTFETSVGIPDCYAGLAGDFDGQGISFGVVQWNIGQGTLQPLLAEMLAQHQDVMAQVFPGNLAAVQTMLTQPLAAQLAWARSIQDPVRHTLLAPWSGMFPTLGRTPEFQAIQVEHADAIHQAALGLCQRFGVTTERALALMFDIRVQNGAISAATEVLIRADFAAIPAGAAPMDAEVAKLQSIANRRAEASNPQYVEDVRARKLAIANGGGTVHGMVYDLEGQFGIRLAAMVNS